MEPEYSFYEIVRVVLPSATGAAGEEGPALEGAVLGRSQDADGRWYYAVHLYERGEVEYYAEGALEPTGKHDRRESFYDGTQVRITINPQTGEGRAKE